MCAMVATDNMYAISHIRGNVCVSLAASVLMCAHHAAKGSGRPCAAGSRLASKMSAMSQTLACVSSPAETSTPPPSRNERADTPCARACSVAGVLGLELATRLVDWIVTAPACTVAAHSVLPTIIGSAVNCAVFTQGCGARAQEYALQTSSAGLTSPAHANARNSPALLAQGAQVLLHGQATCGSGLRLHMDNAACAII
jgi:hypothetical protein